MDTRRNQIISLVSQIISDEKLITQSKSGYTFTLDFVTFKSRYYGRLLRWIGVGAQFGVYPYTTEQEYAVEVRCVVDADIPPLSNISFHLQLMVADAVEFDSDWVKAYDADGRKVVRVYSLGDSHQVGENKSTTYRHTSDRSIERVIVSMLKHCKKVALV